MDNGVNVSEIIAQRIIFRLEGIAGVGFCRVTVNIITALTIVLAIQRRMTVKLQLANRRADEHDAA